MQKAYDPKDLVQRLAKRGVTVAESAAKVLIEELFGWTHESAQLSENKIDDLIDAAVLPKLKDFVLSQVDKIDGQASSSS